MVVIGGGFACVTRPGRRFWRRWTFFTVLGSTRRTLVNGLVQPFPIMPFINLDNVLAGFALTRLFNMGSDSYFGKNTAAGTSCRLFIQG